MRTECGSERPPKCSNSRTSSNDAESLPPGVQIGKSLDTSPGICDDVNNASRACIQLRLPRTVLISPLCEMYR